MMTNLISKHKMGFTLVEIILYISVFSVFILSVSVFLPTIIEAGVKNEAMQEVDQQGLLAMLAITQSIRNSSLINPSSLGSSETLELSAPDSIETYVRLNSGAIEIKNGNGNYVPVSNNRVTVSNLSFSNLSGDERRGIVRIQFTISSNNPSQRSYLEYSKTFLSSSSIRY